MKLNKIFIAVTLALTATIQQAGAQSLKDILGGLSGNNTENSSSDENKSGLGDILSAVGKAVGAEVSYKSLIGSWEYTGAAVGFQSDNLLKKAGGAAAATALEKKLTPYYQKAGLTNLKITFTSDSTFTMNVGKVKLSGNVTKGSAKGSYVFNFKALGKVKIGQMTGYLVNEGVNTVSLTFDASKLIALVEKIAAISGNSSIKAVSSLLSSYDGCTIGFKMKKTSSETSK